MNPANNQFASVINSIHRNLTDRQISNLITRIEFLVLARCVDVNLIVNGHTALHAAARWHLSSIVAVLLRLGADVHICNADRRTALHLACYMRLHTGAINSITCLLSAGANPNAKDRSGNTPLHYCTESNCFESLTALIDAGAEVNIANADGLLPLYCVSAKGALVDLLLNTGHIQDVDAVVPFTYQHCGCTALHRSVLTNCESSTISLLAHGASVDVCDSNGDTLFHNLESATTTECLVYALAASVDIRRIVNGRNDLGETPLQVIATQVEDNSSIAKIQFLVAAGARYSTRHDNRNGFILLSEVAEKALQDDIDEYGLDEPADFRDKIAFFKELEASRSPSEFGWYGECQAQIENARRKLVPRCFAQIKFRCTLLCIALQSLRLPALVTLTIIDAEIDRHKRVPMHLKWNLVTTIKHWVQN